MAFLDAFGPAQRQLFEDSAQTVRLTRGQFLLRRGEPGGDVFLLRAGTLEAVDSRASPVMVLNTLTPGTVVGEMAFVDNSPRSVDVRAGSAVEVLRWSRAELRALLGRNPDLAAVFYESVARLAAQRVRSLTEGAVAGAYGAKDKALVTGADELRTAVDRLAYKVKAALPPIETALRRDPDDAAAAARLRHALDQLQADVDELFTHVTSPAERSFAAQELGQELHAYFVRSVLAERAIRRPHGATATPDVLSHVLVDLPAGDGRLGELIDRWLLDRPTFVAIRQMRGPLVAAMMGGLKARRVRRVLVVNVGTGSVLHRLLHSLDDGSRAIVTILDQSREVLAMVDDELPPRSKIDIETVQENLARFANGRSELFLPRQDAVVLHGLLEYLPERIAVSLLATARDLLTGDGVIAVATLAPSPDRALLDRVLSWPTLRRDDAALSGLMRAAGLRVLAEVPLPEPARVFMATREVPS